MKISIIFILFLTLISPVYSGVWIHSSSIQQGEYTYITGLHIQFKKKYNALNKCNLSFNNKKYSFFLDIVNQELYQESAGEQGYQYIARIPTTPNTPTGIQTLTLSCPLGQKEYALVIKDGEFDLQHITLSKKKSSLSTTEKEVQSIRKALATETPIQYWDNTQTWQHPTTASYRPTYGYRRTYNGVLAKDYFHKGTDYSAGTGSPVTAPAAGKVILTGHEKDGYQINGNIVIIDHGQGLTSAYLHLSDILVKEGQRVTTGQIIGKVGNTGISTGPHLHWGVYLHGENIDPIPLTKEIVH